MRVLIADDHPLVRSGIHKVVNDNFDVEAIDQVGTGQEALDKIGQNYYDIVLMDITMPGIGGLEVVKQLEEEHNRTPVLILSAHNEIHFAVRALKTGAAGYLTKMGAADELVDAIEAVMRGEKYISASFANALASHIGQNGATLTPHDILTTREFEILRHIVSGTQLITIAEKLALSAKTVSAHRANIMKKMNMNSNAELVRYATEQGLID